jgi:hypothetical protein
VKRAVEQGFSLLLFGFVGYFLWRSKQEQEQVVAL